MVKNWSLVKILGSTRVRRARCRPAVFRVFDGLLAGPACQGVFKIETVRRPPHPPPANLGVEGWSNSGQRVIKEGSDRATARCPPQPRQPGGQRVVKGWSKGGQILVKEGSDRATGRFPPHPLPACRQKLGRKRSDDDDDWTDGGRRARTVSGRVWPPSPPERLSKNWPKFAAESGSKTGQTGPPPLQPVGQIAKQWSKAGPNSERATVERGSCPVNHGACSRRREGAIHTGQMIMV